MHAKQKNYRITFEGKAYQKRNIEKSLKKLQKYEKTGLTPEQIIQLDEMYADKCKELADKKAAVPEDARKTISQLESLHCHCMGMINRKEEGEVWEADCRALEAAIESIKQQTAKDNGGQDRKRGIRIYLSGPITGTDDYMERFAEAEEKLTIQGYSVINPAKILASLPDGFVHEEHMTICMELLTACDAICMLDGWEKSPGANREYGYAFARGMHTVPMEVFEETGEENHTVT